MTSSSEFHEGDGARSEEFFARDADRTDAGQTFDPISAFYAPKADAFEANAGGSDTPKSAQKSLMIDNLLNIRNEESCSMSEIK